MFITSKKANVWVSRFPYFKVNFCRKLQWICHEKHNWESAFNCAILSPIVSNANIHCNFPLKIREISRTKHLRIQGFWAFYYLQLPFNNIEKNFNNLIYEYIYDFLHCMWNEKISRVFETQLNQREQMMKLEVGCVGKVIDTTKHAENEVTFFVQNYRYTFTDIRVPYDSTYSS